MALCRLRGKRAGGIKNMVGADRELEALSRVLQGFDASADDNEYKCVELILRYTQYNTPLSM